MEHAKQPGEAYLEKTALDSFEARVENARTAQDFLSLCEEVEQDWKDALELEISTSRIEQLAGSEKEIIQDQLASDFESRRSQREAIKRRLEQLQIPVHRRDIVSFASELNNPGEQKKLIQYLFEIFN